MKNTIPAPYYKRAAEIMVEIPDVNFFDIVAVLYAHDTWIAKQTKQSEPINEPEETAEKIHRTYKGRKPYSRRERKHYVEAVVDGKEYTAKSKIILFTQLGIKDEYEKRQHTSVLPFINASIVEIEYEFLKATLEKYGSKLESYSAYDFDGQFKTIETKPEVANA